MAEGCLGSVCVVKGKQPEVCDLRALLPGCGCSQQSHHPSICLAVAAVLSHLDPGSVLSQQSASWQRGATP